MDFTVVIPARYASTRLPGKPLLDILGKPMIQRVWEQARQSAAAMVVIATDDARIEKVAREFGAEVCLTSAAHPSGTDRLQEVAQKLELAPEQIVVNVQGDEPLIPPDVINQVAGNLATHTDNGVATLAEPIHSADDFLNPNIVKLVADQNGRAMYFSRAPIAWPRDHFQQDRQTLPEGYQPRRHIGIYAYRVAQLQAFVGWPVAPIEKLESLEQLRFLWHSVGIHVADACQAVPGGVDTQADLDALIERLKIN